MRYLLLIVMILHLSCENEPVHTAKHIDIDLDHLIKDPLPTIKIESLIPLETHDSSLLGMVDAIEVHNEHVYILDIFKSRALFAFSSKGAFIKKTRMGKGPGEVVNPFALYIDKQSDLIYLWDQGSMFMLKYGEGLTYIGQEIFGNPLMNFAVLEDGRTLVHSHYHQDFSYKIFGADNETVEKTFIPDIKYPGSRGVFRSISTNKRTLLIAPYQYHIYELRDNEVSSAYYMDFGKYNLTKEDIERGGMSGARELVQRGERVTELADIAEGESFLAFRVYFKSEELNFIYSFKDERVHLLNDYFTKNMLPVCSIRGIAEGDRLYALVEPEELDNFQKAGASQLSDFEIDPNHINPYLITFTLGL